MSTIEDVGPPVVITPVEITSGPRGGPPVGETLRRDRWWLQPTVTVSVLTAFVVYVTWAAFQGRDYYVGLRGPGTAHRDLISPLYSPCLTQSCVAYPGSHPSWLVLHWWTITPALLILVVPGGFRVTCYYYRKAYYRSFWHAPVACGVADAHRTYSGETRF